MNKEFVIIVKNKTRLEALTERFNTMAQAKFYIEKMGGSFDDYESEHEVFHHALNSVQKMLSKVIKYKILERFYVPSFIFSEKHIIIVIGQDGLVANTAKYSKGIPIIAINPDKRRYDGVLLPFDFEDFIDGVNNVMANNYQSKVLRFAEAKLNDGQRLLAFNDLFVGLSSHGSARYKITFQDQTEEQSSSGIIISTLTGSSGWLSSLYNMAFGLAGVNSRHDLRNLPSLNSNELIFAVREPFKSMKTQIDLISGLVSEEINFRVESLMPSNGVIFSDGVEIDFLKFNSGAIATIGIAKEYATLVKNVGI